MTNFKIQHFKFQHFSTPKTIFLIEHFPNLPYPTKVIIDIITPTQIVLLNLP